MSQVTPPSSWALLLCACAKRRGPFSHFSFCLRLGQPEMPPDAGHGKRESAAATIPGCYVFPVPKPSCTAFANRSNDRQDRFFDKYRRRNTRGRKPCPHDNDGRGISVTAAGKRGFPFFSCAALSTFSVARCAIPHISSFSFPPLHVYGQCPHAAIPDGISGHFRCRGKGKDGIRNTNFCRQNLHTSQAQVVFHRKNLLNLLP